MELDQDILQEFNRDFSDDSFKENNATDMNYPELVHLQYLEKYFGHTSFRPLQWDIINAVMNRKRDVCAIMATGYGKSLCYQYPAVFTGGVAIVISPLISLMEDQVQALTISNIPACLLGSAGKSSVSVLENDYRVIYMTPEFVSGERGKEFLNDLKEKNIVVIAVDEAHCISSWGHDFRFAYCELKVLRNIFPDVPLLAVSATATPRVRNDITSSLKMRDPLVLCSTFDRPNLYFEVNHKCGNSLITNLKSVFEGNWKSLFRESTIVYTLTRSRADEIAEELNVNNIRSLSYHAGKTLKQRNEVHQHFIDDEINVIVATIAFGMGINKPDVRNIIHFGAARDMDSYYQEVGRAGRDGSPAKCITFYSLGDFAVHERLRENASNEVKRKKERMSELMKQYLQITSCRRAFILSYFEGKTPDSLDVRPDCCDICKSKSLINVTNCTKFGLNPEGKYKVHDDYVRFLTVVRTSKVKYGLKKYIAQLSKQKQFLQTHPTYNLKANDFARWWQEIAKLLIRDGYITEIKRQANDLKYTYSVYTVSGKGIIFLENAQKGLVGDIWETLTTDMYRLLKCSKPSQTEQDHSVSSVAPVVEVEKTIEKAVTIQDDGTKDLYKALLKKRLELAESCDCMPYMVASNEALMRISITKPKDLTELSNLKLDGFTEGKIQRFGLKLLEEIQRHTVVQKKSLQSVLLKNPLKNDYLQIPGNELASLFEKSRSVCEIADLKNTTEKAVWESIATALREGFEFRLAQFGITPDMKEDVARIILKDNTFLDKIPDFNAAETFQKNNELHIEVGKILLIWTYLQIRLHLQNLNVEYDDFDPMSNMGDFYFTGKTMEENNLNMLLDEIKNQAAEIGTMNEASDDSSTASNISSDERNSPVLGGSKKHCEQQQNDESSVFDDEFNDVLERMETPPLVKKQKLDLPVDTKDNNTNCSDAVNEKNTQEIVEDKIPNKRSFSLLKKKTKSLPPWLRSGT